MSTLDRPRPLHNLDWTRFDPNRLAPELVRFVRATCLVESRADLYSAYLGDVLRDHPASAHQMVSWGEEEATHGDVLRRWLELADPTFDFEREQRRYRDQVPYYEHRGESVRGSIANELLCRCVVETLASAYYRALGDACDEPLLKEICRRLARDEARHFAMFFSLLQRHRRGVPRRLWSDLKVVRRRIRDLENDQVSFAFYASGFAEQQGGFSARSAALRFLPPLLRLYQREHLEYAGRLLARALGIPLPRRVARTLAVGALAQVRSRAALLNLERGVRDLRKDHAALSQGALTKVTLAKLTFAKAAQRVLPAGVLSRPGS